MSLVFKQLYNGENVKTISGIAFKILTITADATDFTPTPSLVYTLSSDGTYYIIGKGFTDLTTLENDTSGGTAGSGLDSTWTGGDLYISNKYNDKPVLAIAPRAFQDVTNITTCYIQEGITHIGHRAFQKSSAVTTYALESITLPRSLTYLGGANGRVFYGCPSLVSIDIKNLTVLELNTFYNCTSLKNIDLPNVETIGANAFSGCTALENLNIPKAISISGSAFKGCESLTILNLPEIISISNDTFEKLISLKSVNMPKATSIGDNAFYGCKSLTDINIPLVTNIGVYAFDRSSLISIDLPLVSYIPNGVFNFCSKLANVNIPKAITIGENAFQSNALTNVYLPEVTSIRTYAFYYCKVLTSIYVPKLAGISMNAFGECFSLKTVIITQETQVCTLYNENAFYNCHHILGTKHATYNPTGVKDGFIYVPDSLVNDYKQATNWSTYADAIKPLSELPQEYKDLYNIA